MVEGGFRIFHFWAIASYFGPHTPSFFLLTWPIFGYLTERSLHNTANLGL
ncbi:MAG: hypothetical protein F6K35_28070 [Okeania sp. SIO2H7]|nr:hypothetical protein [Okeania sp. SIO2H7]